ncbi:MAG TPA: SDR family NAD(P)-dependent oxidoreductase [Caulobacteraceae bacterium]|jgi:3-oxoacyl-[acyl-carrier protein] reductase|nr:SDR family NAD(P)-dependent oxidoreductase [Caulobacteraceae bacterium]
MPRLSDKVALITGAGRGIGRAVALKLAGEGANIVLNDLDPEPAAAVVAEIEALGVKALAVPGDVAAADFGERFVGAATERFGGLDIVVNNAGYTWDGVIQNTADDQFEAMMAVHVSAPFRILRAAAGPIRELAKAEAAEGRTVHRKVVNVSSMVGLYGNAGQIGYSTAKAAVVGMTRTLAKEWGRYAVNVNAVAFGLIETRLTQPAGGSIEVGGHEVAVGVQPGLLQMMKAVIPLGRAGTPEEAAGAVWLFCTPESDYISGQVVLVGGGLLI